MGWKAVGNLLRESRVSMRGNGCRGTLDVYRPWQIGTLAAPPFCPIHGKVSPLIFSIMALILPPTSPPWTGPWLLGHPSQPSPPRTVAPHITLVGEPPAENGLQRHPLDGYLGEQRNKPSN